MARIRSIARKEYINQIYEAQLLLRVTSNCLKSSQTASSSQIEELKSRNELDQELVFG